MCLRKSKYNFHVASTGCSFMKPNVSHGATMSGLITVTSLLQIWQIREAPEEWGLVAYIKAYSRTAPSQWETALLCNVVSRWLGASLESALHILQIHEVQCIAWLFAESYQNSMNPCIWRESRLPLRNMKYNVLFQMKTHWISTNTPINLLKCVVTFQ